MESPPHLRESLVTQSRGFTLVELLVVLAIITIVSAVALTSRSTFDKTLLLANTAYDIGITLRSAETYGISSRAYGSNASIGYGVHFEKASPGSFVFFADSYPGPSLYAECHPASNVSAPDARAGDCVYQSAQGEMVQSYALGNSVTISDFCAYSGGAWSCASTDAISSLDIVFARPNPKAYMSTNGAYSSIFPVTAACITLSAGGSSRYVAVSGVGQINASATSCP